MLVELAQRAQMNVGDEEAVELKRFQRYVEWAGSYPTPKSLREPNPRALPPFDFRVSLSIACGLTDYLSAQSRHTSSIWMKFLRSPAMRRAASGQPLSAREERQHVDPAAKEGVVMTLRKFCSPALPAEHPMHCSSSPQCEHHWFYDFRVNRKRYRDTTETANKQGEEIEAKERSRILEGRHRSAGSRTSRFARSRDSICDHAELHKRSVDRDREILDDAESAFGSLILPRNHGASDRAVQTRAAGGQVARARAHERAEADSSRGRSTASSTRLRGILSKAVEWGKLLDSPARTVKRLKVDNRRTRILTEDEQPALLAACPKSCGAWCGWRSSPAPDRRTAGAALGRRRRDGTDVPGDEERTVAADPVCPAIKAVLDQCAADAISRGCSRTRGRTRPTPSTAWRTPSGGRSSGPGSRRGT